MCKCRKAVRKKKCGYKREKKFITKAESYLTPQNIGRIPATCL